MIFQSPPGVHVHFYWLGAQPKLACIIHLDFTRTPGGLQMNHMESGESTCQIAVWILPGLTQGQSTWSPGGVHLVQAVYYFTLNSNNKAKKRVALPRIEAQTMGIFSVMQPTAPQQLFLGYKATCTYYLFGPCQIWKCRHKACHMSLPLQPPPSHASHGSSCCSHCRRHLRHCYHHPTRREVSSTFTTPPTTLTVQMVTTTLTTKPMWHTHPGVPCQQRVS